MLFVPVKSYNNHIKNECAKRDIKCEICNQIFRIDKLNDHKLDCIRKDVTNSIFLSSFENRIKQLEIIVKKQQDIIDNLSLKSLSNSVEISPFIWKVSPFEKLRNDAISGKNSSIHSPSFYSSSTGYRMCLRLNLNGVDSSIDKYISVFVHLVQGEYDDALSWPFRVHRIQKFFL